MKEETGERRAKVVPIGSLWACRRFGGAPPKLGRVVREATPDYYIMRDPHGVTEWLEWSGALDPPSAVDLLGDIEA